MVNGYRPIDEVARCVGMEQVLQSGQILYVRHYEACCRFYEEQLGLAILFANADLTCFDCYGSYLMVERQDDPAYLALPDGVPKTFSCLRLNVADVKAAADDLSAKGVTVNYQEYSWGTVAKFTDPDGNLIAFKDQAGYLLQIQEYRGQTP